MSHRNEILESPPWSAAEPEGAVEKPAEAPLVVGKMDQTPPSHTEAGEPPSSKIYGVIEEVTAAGTRRWRVGVVRRGQLFAKTFSEKRFGGPEGAKAAALAYRDEVVRQYPMVSKREYHVLRRVNTTSGIPGVRLLESETPPKWVASIQYANGRHVSKTFCTGRYGFDMARTLAIEARRGMLCDVVDQKTIRPTNEIVQALAPELAVDELVMPGIAEYPRRVYTHSSEVPGVFLNKQTYKDKHGQDAIRHVWVAEYRWPDKKVRRVTFSESRYEAEQAKQMALDQHAAWQINPPERVIPGALRKVVAGRKPVSDVQRLVVQRKTKAGIVQSASWIVQYRWSNDGRVQRAAFAVARYGEDEALRLATLQRQHWLQTPPEKQARKRDAPPQRRAYTYNNPMAGVCCFTTKSPAKFDWGSERKHWLAEYKCADGHKLRRLFPEHTYGAKQARQLAIEQRQRWELSPPDAGEESDAKD